LSTVQKLSERPFRPIAEAHVAATIARIRGAKGNYYQLDDEQQAAVRYITQGIGAIKVVSGFAGAGKTDMLSAAKEALEKEGYRVIGTALAGVAARNLEESSGIKSETVRMRELQLLGPSLGKTIKHHAVQLGRAAIGKNTASLPRLDIDRRTVLVIDEAGMLGTRDFAMLAKAVVQGGGTIIAIGDDKQLPSIERGGGFKYLVETLGGVKLSEIRRQRDVGDRAAVKNVVAGNPEESLWHYAAKGQFFVAGQQEAVEAQLLADWTRNGGAECPSDHRIFASTRTEVARLNTLAQQERLQAGFLDAREAIRHEGVTFIVGDRVRFNAAMKACGIQKGETGTVVACKDSFTGKYLAVARSEGGPLWSEYALQVVKHHALQLVNAAIGKQTTLPPPRQDILLVPLETSIPFSKVYRGLSLDYAMTTHLGQGQTVENAYVLLGGKMTDRELSYVQMSRHRNVLQLYAGEQHAGKELAEMARRHYKGQEFASIESELPDYSTLVARIRQSHIKDLASSPSYNAEFYHAAANEQY
jgi:ATP-dependent exoDNAse (exonuclease V) alpha subunit